MNATVLARIDVERVRQNHLVYHGKIPWNAADRDVGDDAKLAVLVEEVGEVAKAMLWVNAPDAFDIDLRRLDLVDELVHVAAVAVAWLEALDAAGLVIPK